MTQTPYRVLGSGATELWAAAVRPGSRSVGLGDAALEAERPLHLALDGEELTLCGMPVRSLREYAVDFTTVQPHLRCPGCDSRLDGTAAP